MAAFETQLQNPVLQHGADLQSHAQQAIMHEVNGARLQHHHEADSNVRPEKAQGGGESGNQIEGGGKPGKNAGGAGAEGGGVCPDTHSALPKLQLQSDGKATK